ncbi:hypothetical protein GO755_13275 [Spirosoma sp. HMF4905]|uniref:YhhN-like protein n=1 Tax=Spirosoma arboris TaxID=2682092 RepID=A0A7K1SB64_9BACT|nr:hypothetical protein [Spirosoma arboris]MVM31005.1 hypothetical protein [Spirosoma arboris]
MWDTFLYITLMGVSTYLYSINYRVLTPSLRLLAINITVLLAGTLYAIYVWRIENKPNIYIYHILPIIQYTLYGLLFSQLIEQALIKRIIWLSIGLFGCISIILSSTVQPWHQYNSYGITLFNILIGLLAGYYLWRTFIDIKVVALEKEAMFWVATGLFFTSLGDFFVQGLMDYLITNERQHALTVYWIHELMQFLLLATFLLALYVYLRYSPISSRR